ncbi:MAG: UvrD-helicase domain-containing protein [Bacteroidales bacterium]|nr:UvrD-helicase domain-containing protein [Bacteroidales bacterium]
MLVEVAYASAPLIVISCIIITAVIIAYHNFASKRKYKQQVDTIASKTKQLAAALDELFKPVERTTQEDVDRFLADNHVAINDAKQFSETRSRFKDLLNPTGIYEFLESIKPDSIQSSLVENHTVYDAIAKLGNLCMESKQRLDELIAPDHYFSFSEMISFKRSLSEIEKCERIVSPKYNSYLRNKAIIDILNAKKNIERLRQQHNDDFIKRELATNKDYFDTVLGKYPLDPQQRDSIVKLEDNCLVIASAGSGKTSTILGKSKYLVERRNIAPENILLITYTRKAANELQERMKIDGVTCSTFHALAYQIIAQVTGQSPSICDPDTPLNVFYNLIDKNKRFLHAINNYIINQQSMMGLEHDYNDAFSYYEDRKKYGIQALFPDMDGKIIFTRSEEEKRLVSMLTRLGVKFRYENNYLHNTTTPEKRQYKPDFTIYFQDAQGQLRCIYLEHFAIDSSGRVPQWFGEGTKGGWKAANDKYNEGITWKRSTHNKYGTVLIETTSADFRNGTVEGRLISQLKRYGVPIKERTDKELYQLLTQRNRKLEKSVYTLILSFVTLMKANEKSIDMLMKSCMSKDSSKLNMLESKNEKRCKQILTDIIKPFCEEYKQTLEQNYEIDFTDAIIQATDLCRKGLWRQYEYILVDEFQDISVDRYKFLQALRSESPLTKLYCVGDDWQSIFRFAGSDMSLFYEFEKYFGFTELCKIETTYRFHQPLIDESSAFIMKNHEQKKKTIKTPDDDKYKTYISFVKCNGEDKDGVLNKVEEIVSSIPTNQSILLLGRYNYDAISIGFNGKIDNKDNRIRVKICGRELPFLSVHSAKGLEADHVILVNCNQGAYGFPALIEDDPVLDFVLSKKETYPFAEERRLFYVAMTRARMKMHVLYDQKKPSPFIGEFLIKLEKGSYLCPKCLEGMIMPIKEGVAVNGTKYRSFTCSNKEGGCDFLETKYGDTTSPGIKITERMTVQDIEKLREARRKSHISIS